MIDTLRKVLPTTSRCKYCSGELLSVRRYHAEKVLDASVLVTTAGETNRRDVQKAKGATQLNRQTILRNCA